MKALYRRYRPKKLSEVVGQPQITEPLTKALENGKIAHSYLFIGPRGCGKTSVARILAHEINNFEYELEDSYLDIIEIDAASNTGVDNIRELREKAMIAPTKGKYKVYIIDEVHMLSKSAFNALLKTLEEPPAHVIFIMATTDAYKVPITITSRSQVYTFKLADPSTMFEHVKKIAKSEKIDIEDEAIKIVIKRGGGSFRDTLSILDQLAITTEDKITASFANHILGLPQDETIQNLLTAYASGDSETIRTQLKDLYDSGIKPEQISSALIEKAIEDPNPSYLPLLNKLTEQGNPSFAQVKLLLALLSFQSVPIAQPQVQVRPLPQSAPAPKPAPQAAPVKAPQIVEKPAPKSPEVVKPQENPEEAIQSETPVQPIQPIQLSSSDDELWNQILGHFKEANDPAFLSVLNQASGCQYDGKTVKIFAGKNFTYKRLDKERAKLAAILPKDSELVIESGALIRDQSVADIAAIMGGGEEVQINE